MIKNYDKLRKFEDSLIRAQKADYFQNLRIFEGLYKEAVALGALPLKDPLEGIDVDIRLAKSLNSV